MKTCPGLDQYAIKKFADAFEAFPRALAENSGVKANELISKMYSAHHEGDKNAGFDIEVGRQTMQMTSPRKCACRIFRVISGTEDILK